VLVAVALHLRLLLTSIIWHSIRCCVGSSSAEDYTTKTSLSWFHKSSDRLMMPTNGLSIHPVLQVPAQATLSHQLNKPSDRPTTPINGPSIHPVLQVPAQATLCHQLNKPSDRPTTPINGPSVHPTPLSPLQCLPEFIRHMYNVDHQFIQLSMLTWVFIQCTTSSGHCTDDFSQGTASSSYGAILLILCVLNLPSLELNISPLKASKYILTPDFCYA
jgi:hypothetical protein